MRTWSIVVGLLAGTTLSAAGQPNPFKVAKSNLKGEVNYPLSGDQTGTAKTAFDGDRQLSLSEGTVKMMGKSTKMSTWTLVTGDSMYSADLEKKEGTVMANLLPYYAKAYDQLDGAGKRRFHENIKDMGALMSRAFGMGPVNSLGEKVGDETVAGEVCENRRFASFTVCSMKKGAPLMLKSSGDLLCFRFEQTATSVSLNAPPGSAFEKPAGVKFTPLPMADADSAARGVVGYLSSQALSDSLAAARAELEQAKAEAAAQGKPTEMTAEQKEQMRQACEVLKNFDMGQVVAGAMKAMQEEIKNAAVDAVKQGATNKLKGLIKKPKIPF
ncbi:MAG: hypothetical protein FJ206_02085 [Gemmatimonadetes bacterium]|nr:hypothetical protein [Gemmatimonadota bacterium]